MKVLTAQQMHAAEQTATHLGASLDQLMENAGLAVARVAWDSLRGRWHPLVLVLVGPGNNGADGLVAARHLQAWGATVAAYLCTPRLSEDPRLLAAQKQGVQAVDARSDESGEQLSEHLSTSAMVIDAILGIGRSRPMTGPLNEILQRTAAARKARGDLHVLALDVPSGLRADTGEVDPATIYADTTVTLGAPKRGLFLFPGAGYVGRLRVVDIGIPSQALADTVAPELMAAGWVRSVLPERPQGAHKGTFGKLLVLAGSQSYLGAAYLACMGAARVGAGYVTLAIPFRLQAILAAKLTEVTYLTLPETTPGAVSPDTTRVIRQALSDYNALLIGPGLGQAPSTVALVRSILLGGTALGMPVVADADALNTLAQTPEWWERFKAPAILTPHPGEMARLLDQSIAEVEESRWQKATDGAQRWETSLVLKGAYTVVASPQGRLRVSPFANPALATAGTGDVLSGVIAGLLVQGVSPADAASAGVYLHALAGELLRDQVGEAGAVASDLLPLLPKALRLLKENQWRDAW
ncbi:MAG: NAD(P)H-hydrate dehydratase [Dehalococcoidia bacterium]|nr:NAD(P)H-hydrate dehydratase [Dehalococcoidia bacterium]